VRKNIKCNLRQLIGEEILDIKESGGEVLITTNHNRYALYRGTQYDDSYKLFVIKDSE
jgi:hypothetical protein